ncbi:MAG: Crp/Fnr family transcriptional regulator [Chitinophagales bacterium]
MASLDLKEFSRKFDFLSPEDIGLIMQHVHIEQLKKGDFFIRAGEMSRNIALVQEGLLRCFYIKENGEEVNAFFRWEGTVIGAYECIIKETVSSQYIQAIEDCILMSMDFSKLEKLYDENRNLERAGKMLLQNTLSEALQKIASFITDSPETRYIKLLEEYPDLNQRIPNKYIASFLGITPVSLSRIRSRIHKSKSELK